MTQTRTGTIAALFFLCALPAAAAQQFAEQVSPHMPHLRDPGWTMAAADVDGDGDQDLVVANNAVSSGWQNRLYLSNGKGVFTDVTATHLPAGTHRTAGLALGDVDGDGDVDIVTANWFQNRLYLNNGTGVFHEATFGRMPVDASDCRGVRLCDLDKDGDLDLVFAAYRQELLYLNNGAGVFTDVTSTHMVVNQTSSWDVDAGDIDGDGDLDLIIAEQNGLLLLLNDGTAHVSDVTAARLPKVSALCQDVNLADVDKDGDLDLVCGYWSARPTLHLNDGAGTFTDATAGRLGTSMISADDVTLGDIDGDGDPDLVLSGWFDRHTPVTQVHRNDGTGTFTDVSATHYLSRATSYTNEVVLVDADGDGDLDMATTAWSQPDRLLFNDGHGVFVDATPARLYALSDVPHAAALADLDGDGDLDLVFANVYYEWQSWPNRLHRNDGRGNFTDVTRTHLPADTAESRAVVCGDVDKDGDVDILFGNFGGQNTLYLNDGTAHFSDATAQRMPVDTDGTTSLALGDVNGDGYLDLVAGNHLQQIRLYLNDKSGAFVDATTGRMPAAVHETRALALADVDGDGDLDLLVAAGLVQGARNRLLLNDGTGVFTDVTAARMPALQNASSCVAVGDVDGDGDLDVVFGNDSLGTGATNRLYRNNGSGAFTYSSVVYDLDNTRSIAMFDADEDGDLDVVSGNFDFRNKLALNDGKGNFSAAPNRMPGVSENTRAVVAGDVDGDGDIDLVTCNSGSVSLESAVYANRLRQLSAPRLPRIGDTWDLEVHSRAGFATAPQAAIVMISLVPAAIPLPPYGVLGLDPNHLLMLPPVSLTAPDGAGGALLPIPPVASLVGLTAYAQAGVMPTPNLADARLTNVVAARISDF